jgi:glutamate racemase
MSDNRPIGVFDSGVGGLTVLQALHASLPLESTVYLGDLARLPYGPRPQGEVREFALQAGDFLASSGIKLLVVACNTATAAAYEQLRTRYPFPVVGVIAPGAAEAARRTRNCRIGVIATNGTVSSRAYTREIQACLPGAVVLEHPASWLVPIIESGEIADVTVQARLQPLLSALRGEDIDTLILGCTHFPLLRHLFETGIGDGVEVLDSASTTVREVSRLLAEFRLEGDASARHRFLVTGPSESFRVRAQAMFHASPPIETVSLEAHDAPLGGVAEPIP